MMDHDPSARWDELRSRILRELCHDLNGRASALRGLAELSRAGSSLAIDGDRGRALLGEEADRLEELALNLTALSGRTIDPEELLDVHPFLLRCVRIIAAVDGLHGDRLEVLPPEGDPPPVRASPVALTRVLLLALQEVLEAEAPEADRRPSVRLAGVGGRAEIRLRSGGTGSRGRSDGSVGASTKKEPVRIRTEGGLEVEWEWHRGMDPPELRVRLPLT